MTPEGVLILSPPSCVLNARDVGVADIENQAAARRRGSCQSVLKVT